MEPLRLVIIEDEEAHFTLIQHAIARELPNAAVYHFQDASGCLERLDEIRPSVIIADYLMPGMNGIDFLAVLNQRNIDIPLIMITGQGDENIAVRAMKLGAKDYLVKTGNFFALLPSIIEKVVREKKINDSLQESEIQYGLLVNHATSSIVVTQDGWLKFANPQSSHISGFANEELTSKPFVTFVHPDDRATVMEYHLKRTAGEAVPETYLFRIITRDGQTKWLENKGVLISWHNRPATLNFLSDITVRKQTEDIMRNLSQILLQAQERERLMISYELHDRIAQNLSRLKLDCDTLFNGQVAALSEIKEPMNQFSKLIQQTIDAVRDLAYDLRPPGLDQMSLAYALQTYCLEFSEKSRLKVDMQIAGIDNLNLDDDTKIHLYRLLQEGLVNIQKHADAKTAIVRVVGASPNIILRIEDDGKGFDVRARELALDNEKRLGLRSMRERTKLLGGRMAIQSDPGKGTKIFIKFPFKEQQSGSKEAHPHH